jgi:hypothetical protein
MPNKRDNLIAILKQSSFSNGDISFLFSELRKSIEVKSKKRKTLKFYCDWLLHPQKDRFHSEMKKYIKEIYQNAVWNITNPARVSSSDKITELIYFKVLRNELKTELLDSNLPTSIINGESWLSVIHTLVKLLEDQPLIKPIPEVDFIKFIPSAEGAAILFINFSQPVIDIQGQQNHFYKTGNYY